MSRDKNIPGKYCRVYWDGDGEPQAHYVNGHVTEEEFRDAINSYFGDDSPNKPLIPEILKLEHVYVRSVRSSSTELDGYELRHCAQGRGARPVTYWEIQPNRAVGG